MKKNFSKRLQAILKHAKEDAIRLGHSYVGSEHLLIGLLKTESGISSKIFELYDIDIESVIKMVEDIINNSEIPVMSVKPKESKYISPPTTAF